MEFHNISKFYDKLQDDESRNLFIAKTDFLIHNDERKFIKFLLSNNKNYMVSRYDDIRDWYKNKKVVIRGAGCDGEMTYRILQNMGIEVEGFCDNSITKQNEGFMGKKVISEADLIVNYRDRFVVIASRKFGASMYSNIISKYFPRENIFLPRNGMLYATTGMQYFDCPLFVTEEEEIFVDCGCYDAETSNQFSNWCKGNYNRIIAFEPDKILFSTIKENCKLPHFDIFPYATGEHKHEASFSMTSDGGSGISANGSEKVWVNSIDNVLNGEKATFIKMDVEGAELESLKGASLTIQKYKPKLAISIYHKPEDIVEIPCFIESLRNDYRYYIRHYTNCMWETILYAI